MKTRKTAKQKLIDYLEANHPKWTLNQMYYEGGDVWQVWTDLQSDRTYRCYIGTFKQILEEIQRKDKGGC